jgi:NAD dependent epimerase/dehydratase family enzyme
MDMTGPFLPLDNPAAVGPLNGTAPNPVTNKGSRRLGRC